MGAVLRAGLSDAYAVCLDGMAGVGKKSASGDSEAATGSGLRAALVVDDACVGGGRGAA